MSQAQDIIKPRFAQHIDIHCPDDRAYWAGQFGVSGEELRDAVRMVGSRVSTVAAHLGRQAA